MLFILTGDIRTGKTTWLEARVRELEEADVPVRGVLAPGMWHDGEKVGIQNVLLPSRERVLLAKVQLDPKRSERHQKELLVIAEREASRSWPGVRFSHAIVYGRESLMNLLLATCCADKSTLIVRSSDDMERVPRWILDRFDTIIRENPERALEMLIA